MDTTTRKANFKSKAFNTILFSDTVGFISNLPTNLIESFKATLDDLTSADLLIHVIDAADLNIDFKIHQVDSILDDLGVTEIPQIRALNKIDLPNEPCTQLNNNLYPQLKISTKSGEGIDKLKKEISETLFGEVMAGWVHFLPIHAAIRSKLFDSGCIIEEKIDENGCYQSFIEISQNMFKQLEDLENFKDLKPVS